VILVQLCTDRTGIEPQNLSPTSYRSLPLESDVQTLRTCVMTRISTIVKDEYMVWTASEFIELRSLLVCRLTLFNSRWGGEPARLTLTEWHDAEKQSWLSDETVQHVEDPMEKMLVEKYHLAEKRKKQSQNGSHSHPH